MLFLIVAFNIFATLHARKQGDNVSPRIFYGDKVNITEYPWYSTYMFKNNTLMCGASIISERWLVTAGHCFMDVYTQNVIWMWVGTDDIRKVPGESYLVDLAIRHPDFIRRPMKIDMALNDISLYRVNRSIIFSDKVQPIKLPQHDYEVNAVYKTAAMGIDQNGRDGVLREGRLRTYNITEFIDTFNQTAVKPYREIMLRACIDTKRDDDKPSLCHGDSGSGLVRDNVLVGIASFDDTDECKKSRRAVYTNVYPFVDWIKNVTGIN